MERKLPSLKQKRIKLIALDMDGTLLNRRQEISEENRKAIATAMERGVKVVICTGRHLHSTKPYADSLNLKSYLVVANGGEIWDSEGQLVERNHLDAKDIEMMYDLCTQYGSRYWAMTPDKDYREGLGEKITEEQWLKFGFDLDDHDTREAILRELEKHDHLELSNSSPLNIEVNPIGINKANALKKICEYLGITMEEVMAVGDSLNDIAMIREAGVGVAMGNAQSTVKEAANWVTETNDNDGVAKAIQHWVLNN